jgi:hypothetical protein
MNIFCSITSTDLNNIVLKDDNSYYRLLFDLENIKFKDDDKEEIIDEYENEIYNKEGYYNLDDLKEEEEETQFLETNSEKKDFINHSDSFEIIINNNENINNNNNNIKNNKMQKIKTFYDNSKNKIQKRINQKKENSSPIYIETTEQEYLKKKLKERINEYTTTTKLKIIVGTFNVNSKIPKESLSEWLNFDKVNGDLYVIGLQELEMTAKSVIQEETKKSNDWNNEFEKLFQNIKGNFKYQNLFQKQLVGLYLTVFIKTIYYENITNINFDLIHRGVLGMTGNK